VIYKYIDHLGR